MKHISIKKLFELEIDFGIAQNWSIKSREVKAIRDFIMFVWANRSEAKWRKMEKEK